VKDNIFARESNRGIRTGGRLRSFPRVVFRPPPPPSSQEDRRRNSSPRLFVVGALILRYSTTLPSPPSGRVRRLRLEILELVCCLLRLLWVLFVRIRLLFYYFRILLQCESCGYWLRLVSFVKFNKMPQFPQFVKEADYGSIAISA